MFPRSEFFLLFVERILMDISYILWNKFQDYQLRFTLANHFLVIAWPVICSLNFVYWLSDNMAFTIVTSTGDFQMHWNVLSFYAVTWPSLSGFWLSKSAVIRACFIYSNISVKWKNTVTNKLSAIIALFQKKSKDLQNFNDLLGYEMQWFFTS